MLLTKDQVLTGKLFGDGIPNPRSYGFIGDYLAIATSNISIDCMPAAPDCFKAVHAGMTQDEMNIPLIIIVR